MPKSGPVAPVSGHGWDLFGAELDVRPLKYQEISDRLRRGILAGVWPVGTRLPTEKELVQTTSFSLNTVRRAVDVLVDEGLVERRQGAGTFVIMQRFPTPQGRPRIGVMVPSTTAYFPTVLQGVDLAARSAGASIELESSRYDARREGACIRKLVEAGVEGLLLTPSLAELDDSVERVQQLLDLPVPVVLMERSLPQDHPADRTEYVRTDYVGGGYDAVHHLHALGHRRIMLLLRAVSEPGDGVCAGYLRAIQDLGLPVLPVHQADKGAWERTRAEEMLDRCREAGATAAFVFGDREAALLTDAALRRGMYVPEDLALVSYDNETASTAKIPLSAIDPPKHRLGRMAAQILMQRIAEGESSPVHQLRLRPRLVVRDSCGVQLGEAMSLR